jgi:hypothetical protein
MADIQVTAEFNDIKKLDAEIKRVTASSKIMQTQFQKTGTTMQAFDLATAESVRGVNQFGNVAQVAGKNTNRMGMQLQQVGYQVGDFAVQVQGGTNVAVAFGQQMSQLLGIFGAGGALAGAGIAIATAFIAPLLDMQDKAADVEKQFQELTKSIDSFKESIDAAKMSTAEMNEKFGTFSLEARSALKAIQEIKRIRFNESIDAIANSIRGVDVSNITGEMSSFQAKLFRDFLGLEGRIKQTNSQVVSFVQALQNLQNADGVASQIRAAENLSKIMVDLVGGQQNMTEEQRVFYENLQEIITSMATLGTTTEDVLGSEEGLKAAVQAANQMYQERLDKMQAIADLYVDILGSEAGLRAAEAARQGLFGVGDSGYAGGRGGDPRKFTTADELRKQLQNVYTPRKKRGGSERDPVAEFEKQLQLEQELIGKSEARKRVLQALGVEFVKNNAAAVAGYEAQIEGITEAMRLEEERKSLMASVESSLEAGFMSMVDGTKSVKDAFKQMATDIIRELYRVLVVKRLVSSITGAFGFADGGVFSGGSQVKAFANGGIVGGPTYFPMSGGQTGLMGEAGPEAIMPLKRGANGKLGVEVQGGSGGVTVNNYFTVQANGDESVKRIVQQQIPRIAEATKAAVVDSKRRGGSYGRAFS